MDWRSTESVDEKRRLVEESYGDGVPGYLLFHLGNITRLTDEEELYLNDLFFEGGAPGFGDKEMHGSSGYTGSYLQHATSQEKLAPFVVLRIRDARRMHYSLTLRGEERPLLQVTNGDGSKPIINFMECWGLSPQDVRVGDDTQRPSIPRDPFGAQTAFVPGEVLVAVGVNRAPSGYRVTTDPSGVQTAYFPEEVGSAEVDNPLREEHPHLEPFETIGSSLPPLPRKTWVDKILERIFG